MYDSDRPALLFFPRSRGTLGFAGKRNGFPNTAFASLAGRRLLAALHQFRNKQVLGLGCCREKPGLVGHASFPMEMPEPDGTSHHERCINSLIFLLGVAAISGKSNQEQLCQRNAESACGRRGRTMEDLDRLVQLRLIPYR